MKISDAKEIPLSLVVEALGGKFARKGRSGELWYHSPFRPEEKTASFKIDEAKNRWHDFGYINHSGDSGGDIIDLWCDYHNIDRKAGVKDALDGLAQFSGKPVIAHVKRQEISRPTAKVNTSEPRFKIAKLYDRLFFKEIKEALNNRKISLATASLYLKQVYLQDNDKPERKLNGFAFKNDKGGYEISIPQISGTSFKTSTTPKWFTTISGTHENVVCVFEGFWDFLTWLEMEKTTTPPNTAYILNSVSFAGYLVEELLANANKIELIKLYTDNDNAGFQAALQIAEGLEDSGITVGTMEYVYAGYKDLNEWFCEMRKY